MGRGRTHHLDNHLTTATRNESGTKKVHGTAVSATLSSLGNSYTVPHDDDIIVNLERLLRTYYSWLITFYCSNLKESINMPDSVKSGH